MQILKKRCFGVEEKKINKYGSAWDVEGLLALALEKF